jgi:hypothetical protein
VLCRVFAFDALFCFFSTFSLPHHRAEYEKAITDLTEALQANPDHPNAAKWVEMLLLAPFRCHLSLLSCALLALFSFICFHRYLETTLLRRGMSFERIGRVRLSSRTVVCNTRAAFMIYLPRSPFSSQLAEASTDLARAADLRGPKHSEVMQSLASIKVR